MSGRLFALIGLMLSIGLYFGYISPTYHNAVAPLQKQVAVESTAITSAQMYIKEQAALEQKQSEIPTAKLQQLAKLIPTGANNVGFVNDLYQLASNDGLYVGNFDVGTPSDPAKTHVPYSTTKITITANGTYSSFRQFLDSVEHSLRLIDVTNISVKANGSSKKSASGAAILSYQFTFNVYSMPATTVATATTTTP